MNIFEKAAVSKFRFESASGDLTVENLFDLPLQSKSGVDLDTVAKRVNAQLVSVTDVSFVSTTSNPRKAEFEIKLEIVKHIIGVKQKAAEEARLRAEQAAQKQKLLQVLADKQDSDLKALSTEEIQARLAALG